MTQSKVRLHDLLESMAEGDRSAVEPFYRATADKLYGVALRILRRPELAAQALTETYLRIWREAAAYEPRLFDPLSWAVTLVRRVALDMARRRGDRALDAATSEPAEQDAPEELAEEPAEAETDAPGTESPSQDISPELARLLACLGKLSGDLRQKVLLAYYDGWNRNEFAIEADVPPGTIRTWLLRALEQIRECSGR